MEKRREFWLLKSDDDGPTMRPNPNYWVSESKPANPEFFRVTEIKPNERVIDVTDLESAIDWLQGDTYSGGPDLAPLIEKLKGLRGET